MSRKNNTSNKNNSKDIGGSSGLGQEIRARFPCTLTETGCLSAGGKLDIRSCLSGYERPGKAEEGHRDDT